MGSIDENRAIWARPSSWTDGGDPWSGGWGGPRRQWEGWIQPRLVERQSGRRVRGRRCGSWKSVVGTVVGPSSWPSDFGHVVAVDLVPSCVDECARRFATNPNVSTLLTDGSSLKGVDDRSVDLLFSFDSLVHADAHAIAGYLHEAGRVLADDGVAFVHHSNLAACGRNGSRWLRRSDRIARVLSRARLLEPSVHWRDPTVDADLVDGLARRSGLDCVTQELLPWATRSALIDCVSVMVRSGSTASHPLRRTENRRFADEMRQVAAGRRPPLRDR